MHGQKVELVGLFAEAHQAVDFKAVLQAEQMTGFVDGGFGGALEHQLPVEVVQAVNGDYRDSAAQLGFAVNIGQDWDADIPCGDANFEWRPLVVGCKSLNDFGGVVLVAHGHEGIFGKRMR